MVDSKNKEQDYFSIPLKSIDLSRFADTPGGILAYWLSDKVVKALTNNTISSYVHNFQGIIPGKPEYLRLWQEVMFNRVEKNYSEPAALKKIDAFFPYAKGGSFRRWYGNNNYVIHWKNDGRDFVRSRTENREFFFKAGITWSDISTGLFSARQFESGQLFDAAGPVIIPFDDSLTLYIMAFMNTNVFQSLIAIICQGLHYGNGAVISRPIIIQCKNKVESKVKENIKLARNDWDSFEISWDFMKHPLIRCNEEIKDVTSTLNLLNKNYTSISDSHCSLEQSFLLWQNECQERFEQLKSNEEELNQVFIDIYGLQDELTPDVEDKDITVRKADLKRDIRSLISYAVGCMFGRYSLDVEGLAYAGGEWDSSKYKTFIPDDDNCIPITDEEYFEDDIVGRFCEFLKVVFGEESLEENLNYVAQALGNKGNTSREIIRNYFLNDFFKDHCSTYSVTGSGKRPIYWLFDAGKQNGFKCLIYMHRYDKDTVNRVRSEYLKKMQDAIEGALKNAEYAVDNSSSAVDRAAATRKRDKYIKQLNEIRAYYPALSHMALQRIEIDLDDGVKTNYAKFQGIETVDENGKKQKVDLLAKI